MYEVVLGSGKRVFHMHDLYNLAPVLLILASILLGIVFNQQGLNRLEARMNTRIDHLEGRIDKLDGRMDKLDAKIERVQVELTAKIERLQSDMVEFYKLLATQAGKVDVLWDERNKR